MQSLLPQYLLHLTFINAQMYYAENSRKLTEGEEGYEAMHYLANIFTFLSFLLNIINIGVFFM